MEKVIEQIRNLSIYVVFPILLLADFCALVNLMMCQPLCIHSAVMFITRITVIMVVLMFIIIPAMNWCLDRYEKKRRKKND